MTNHHITDVLASIGEAKRALDAEPQYLSRIRELERQLSLDGQTIAAREQRIHELKQSEETLTAKLRSVEAERDDAGFRLLEESDRVSALSSHLRQVINDSLKLLEVAGGEPQKIVTVAELDAKLSKEQALHSRIAELEAICEEITKRGQTVEAERDEAQASLRQLREAIAPTPIEPPQGESAMDPTPTYGASVPNTGPENDAQPIGDTATATLTNEPFWAKPSHWEPSQVSGERATDPMPSSSYGSGGSSPTPGQEFGQVNNPMSSTSLTPIGEETSPQADPFAPKANTGSASVSLHGADASGSAFWPDSSNH